MSFAGNHETQAQSERNLLRAVMEDKNKNKNGFASLSPERRREIASMGGKSVPSEKRSFSQNPELAAKAGRKGGASVSPDSRSFFRDRSLAAEAGKKSGRNRQRSIALADDGDSKKSPD